MSCFQLHWLVLVSCCVPGSARLTPSGQKMATCERCRGSLYDAICHNTPTQHRIYDHNLLWRDATTLTTLTCKQLTAVYHILSSYSVHQISSAEEVWGSMGTSRVLGCLFSERKSAKKKKRYWEEKMDKTANTGEIRCRLRVNCSEVVRRRSEGDAYLYSQNVSSFMPWDSTSGWRSSFSFTAHKIKRRYQQFPQEMTASEDHWVPRLLTLSE